MNLPEFEHFPSRPTPDAPGRVYSIADGYDLVAYFIPDGMTLRKMGARRGFFLFAFMSEGKVGYWNWTDDPRDLLRLMTRFRLSLAPGSLPPAAEAPGGEPPHIRPLLNRNPDYLLRNAPMPPSKFLDLSHHLEGESEPPAATVSPIRLVRDREP